MMFVQPEIRFVKRINRQRQILLTNRSPLVYRANAAIRATNPYPERRYPTPPKPTRKHKYPSIWAVVSGLAVPDVRGQTLAAAQAQLAARGFTSVLGSPSVNSAYAVNTVAIETPAQGTIQASGTLISLQLSLGLSGSFPDLIGLALADALVVVGNLPGVMHSVVYQDAIYPFPEIPRGTVISQYPLPGAIFNPGVQVDLVVSSGYVFIPGIRESIANDPNPVSGSTAFP